MTSIRRHRRLSQAAVAAAGLALAGCTVASVPSSSVGPSESADPTPAASASPRPPTSSEPTATASPLVPTPSATTPAASPAAGAVWVPGTHVALVPPADFELADEFAGFSNAAADASITIQELPGGPYVLFDSAYEAQGLTIESREEFTLGGVKAYVVRGRQTMQEGPDVERIYLATGSNETSVLLTGDSPIGDEAIGSSIMAALKTTVFDPARPVEPAPFLVFEVSASAPLRMAGILGAAVTFNTEGFLHGPDSSRPSMQVVPWFTDPPDDPMTFAMERVSGMRQLIFQPDFQAGLNVSIGGLDGVAVIAIAWDHVHDPDRRVFVYKVVLVDPEGGRYVEMTGLASEADREIAAPAFRATAESFTFKD